MDKETSIMVKSRYFPNKGTAKDVGGMISASSKKKTVSDSKIEMQRVTWKTKSISTICLDQLMLQIKNQDPWKEKGLKGLQDQINSQNVKTSD